MHEQEQGVGAATLSQEEYLTQNGQELDGIRVDGHFHGWGSHLNAQYRKLYNSRISLALKGTSI